MYDVLNNVLQDERFLRCMRKAFWAGECVSGPHRKGAENAKSEDRYMALDVDDPLMWSRRLTLSSNCSDLKFGHHIPRWLLVCVALTHTTFTQKC